jgi:hypothetical protein
MPEFGVSILSLMPRIGARVEKWDWLTGEEHDN